MKRTRQHWVDPLPRQALARTETIYAIRAPEADADDADAACVYYRHDVPERVARSVRTRLEQLQRALDAAAVATVVDLLAAPCDFVQLRAAVGDALAWLQRLGVTPAQWQRLPRAPPAGTLVVNLYAPGPATAQPSRRGGTATLILDSSEGL
jgi:hypothetical protein